MVLLSILVSSVTATPATIPPDGEFYNHEAVLRCQAGTEEYFGWSDVKWDTAGALAFMNQYKDMMQVTVKGEMAEGIVWGDCSINLETDRLFVHDFAPGPYNPTIEPPGVLTP